MINKKNIILGLIILFAAFLRLWRLGTYPALNADEAAIGYNAFSLLETGLDEHGNSWPIHFQSFNDYKPGLYFYLVLPLVKFFGLNVWSVRIPNATLGVISIGLLYYLVKELFKDRETTRKLSLSYGEVLGLVSAFMLTISPWHIHFSRGGWEVNAATFFILLGAYLFVKGRRNLTLLMLSVLSFSLSMYTYHAARIISPLLGMSLLIIYRKDFKGKLSNILIAGLILLVTLSPLAKDFLKSDAVSRAAGVGLFADPGPLNRINEQRGEHGNFLAPIPILFHNKAVNYGLAFLENWSDHFHGEFLFLNGDVIERNRVPETGQMYLIDMLFIIAGLIGIAKILGKKDQDKKGFYVIIIWLVVAPFAAALTFQSPHALRAQNMVIPLTILSAFGLLQLSLWLHELIGVKPDDQNLLMFLNPRYSGTKQPSVLMKKKVLLNVSFVLFVLLYSWEFGRYLHNYDVHMAKQFPFSSQYGVEELVDYVQQNQEKYKKVLVTDIYDQPYILFLFYMKYPPERFQNDHTLTARDNYGFSTVRSFGKYEFKSIDWDNDQPSNPNSLIIGIPEEISDEANIVKEIYGCNGYKYFEVVAN